MFTKLIKERELEWEGKKMKGTKIRIENSIEVFTKILKNGIGVKLSTLMQRDKFFLILITFF